MNGSVQRVSRLKPGACPPVKGKPGPGVPFADSSKFVAIGPDQGLGRERRTPAARSGGYLTIRRTGLLGGDATPTRASNPEVSSAGA